MRILLLCFISIFSSTLAMSIISISNASFNMSSVDRFLMFVPRTSVLNLSFFLFNYSLYSNYSLFFPLKKEHPSSCMTYLTAGSASVFFSLPPLLLPPLASCHVPGMLFTSVLFFLRIIIRILPDSVSVSFLHPKHVLPLLYPPHCPLLLSYT